MEGQKDEAFFRLPVNMASKMCECESGVWSEAQSSSLKSWNKLKCFMARLKAHCTAFRVLEVRASNILI